MVQVKLKDGVLEGEVLDNEGRSYFSFKGIPYAAPPVADLRFKAPQPLKPWSGVRSAKQHGSICYQYDALTRAPPSGSEDCLYLNVYTPDLKPKTALPVMVFIHGGAFLSGSGNDDRYGPEFLVKKDVILVTINYRLEVIGFLCLDTEEIPGNAGMKDQVAALRWVKENISNFGGDPNNVTIFGESAGGASVAYHLISPMSKGLFKRAIAQSGTSVCFWSHSSGPREKAIALAKKLGCDSEDNKELHAFLKSQPIESLIQIKVPITFNELARDSNDDIEFSIVSEKQFGTNERFLYGDVFDVLRNGIHEGVEVISGFNEQEGLMGLMNTAAIETNISHANDFHEFFVPKPIALNCLMKDKLEFGRKMKQFYYKNQKVSIQNLEPLVDYYGMSMFVYGTMQWQKLCASNTKSNVYLYKFTCKSERNILGHVLGLGQIIGKETIVTHADDLGYMFNMQLLNKKIEPDSNIAKMIDNVVTLWTNFAKYGNPTPDNSLGVKWAPYTVKQQEYLDIGEKLVPGTAPNKEELEFWEKMFRQYYPHFVA